jgi:cystathionine beta-lyase/cystathionine gamma-synthase
VWSFITFTSTPDQAANEKTRAFFCETCSNPALEICDRLGPPAAFTQP